MEYLSSSSTSKWIATVASIYIQCSCGASYAFGIYSPILKTSQSYTQTSLDTVSVFKDIGANAGILSGLLYAAYVSRRRGPWVVHLAGAVQCFVGYFFIWMAVTGRIEKPHVGVMCIFMFLAAHAQTFFNTANVVTSVHNFPSYTGTIVGIMKSLVTLQCLVTWAMCVARVQAAVNSGDSSVMIREGFLGLSGAVLIQVYQTLFAGKPATFLLMLALLPTLLSLALMFFVKVHEVQSRDDTIYLNSFSLISVVVAAYLMLLIILENIFVLSQWARAVALALLFVLLSSPIKVAITAHKHDLHAISESSSTLKILLIKEPESTKPELSSTRPENPLLEVEAEEELNLTQAMCKLNFWLLFVAMLCGMGSGLATINNISQIGESLGYTTRARSTLVSLWSIWNFLGRFGAGYVSDILIHKRGWPRPLVMAITLAAMTGGHIIIGSGFHGNLYIGSVLVGICYGSQWSLMPTITSEIFSVRHMGTIFNTIAVASPLGSYILSVRVIGYIYDREAGLGNFCSGTHCFMLSFFILACASFFGFLVALALLVKTRGVYARIVRRRVQLT